MPTYTFTVPYGVSRSFSFTSAPDATEEIDAYAASQVAVAVQDPLYPVTVALNIAPGAQVTASFRMQGGSTLNVSGDGAAMLTDAANPLADTRATIRPDVRGAGSFTVADGGSIEFGGAVAGGITVNLDRSPANPTSLVLDRPEAFGGLVNFADARITLAGLGQATGWNLTDGILSIFGPGNQVPGDQVPGDQVIDTLRLNDGSPDGTGLSVSLDGQGGVLVTEGGAAPAGGTALAPHAPPAALLPVPAQPPVAVNDGLTGQPVAAPLQPYDGPVAGVQQQFVSISPERLDIFANVPDLFIRTGDGDDAVQLNGGTNVVDAGAGSNFLTSGTGQDTFFVDARGAASDIWSTVANFHSGDAVTLWGPLPSGPLTWFGAGVPGAQGLTLFEPINGSVAHRASLTLAGFTNADLRNGRLSVSSGHDDASGSDYVRVQAN